MVHGEDRRVAFILAKMEWMDHGDTGKIVFLKWAILPQFLILCQGVSNKVALKPGSNLGVLLQS